MKFCKLGCLTSANIALLVAVLWSPSLVAVAQAGQVQQPLDDTTHVGRSALYAFSENLEGLSARFEQTTRDVGGYVIDSLDGIFYFQAPNRFRWAYSEPIPEIIVGDGERLWHYDPSLEQATVRAQPSAADSPILALTNPSMMGEAYSILPGDRSDTVLFLPKSTDSPISDAYVRIEDGQPVAVEWTDNFGQLTRIAFSEMAVNPNLDQALFQFTPPVGVDVLDGL